LILIRIICPIAAGISSSLDPVQDQMGREHEYEKKMTMFIFMHLADAFIQGVLPEDPYWRWYLSCRGFEPRSSTSYLYAIQSRNLVGTNDAHSDISR